MACSVFVADTEAEARFHFSSLVQSFVGMVTNRRGLVPAPIENLKIPPEIAAHVEPMLAASCVGTPEQVAKRLSSFQEQLNPDEYIISGADGNECRRLTSLPHVRFSNCIFESSYSSNFVLT